MSDEKGAVLPVYYRISVSGEADESESSSRLLLFSMIKTTTAAIAAIARAPKTPPTMAPTFLGFFVGLTSPSIRISVSFSQEALTRLLLPE